MFSWWMWAKTDVFHTIKCQVNKWIVFFLPKKIHKNDFFGKSTHLQGTVRPYPTFHGEFGTSSFLISVSAGIGDMCHRSQEGGLEKPSNYLSGARWPSWFIFQKPRGFTRSSSSISWLQQLGLGCQKMELRYGVRQTFGLQTPLRVLVDVRNIWLYINVYLSASVIIENNRKLVFFKRIFAQFSFTPNIEGSYYLVLPPVLMSTLGVHLFLKISPHDLSTCFPSVRWYGFSTGKTTPDSSLLSWVPLPAPYCIYGCFQNRGTPKWMIYNGTPYQNGWFGGTTIFENIHIIPYITFIRLTFIAIPIFLFLGQLPIPTIISIR